MTATAVIINADDLGFWPSIDRGIFAAWDARAISDSTIMANSDRLTELLAEASQVGMPVGIHLNLTSGVPLCDPCEIPDLVTPEGLFMKRRQWPAVLPPEQVRREFQRQAERLLTAGWHPSHLDTHHHIHIAPNILAAVIELAQQLNVPVRAVHSELRDKIRHAGVVTTDHFSMKFYGEQATVDTLIQQLEACPRGTLEIMTHPGYDPIGLSSQYCTERDYELIALLSPRWQDYFRASGVKLISFSELAGR
jgi:predicted glycoside hydrolase/deacetylase ChbG (UPF0249 family)